MLLNHLHAIYVFAKNVKQSSSWYSQVLGLPLSIDEENFALIQISHNELCFHKCDEKSPLTTGGSVGYWNVDNLSETAKIFVKHGGRIYRGPIEIPESDEGICQIQDPFGNVIGLQGKYKN